MSLLHWLVKIDAFCVPFTLSISDKQSYLHRSVCGGIMTILIAILSFTYAGFQFYQWQSWQLIPKVTQYQYDQPKEDLKGKNFISYNLYISNSNSVDNYIANPFSEQDNILTPFIVSNYDFKNIQLAFPKVYKYALEYSYEFDLSNLSENYLIFARCEQKYLNDGQWCADESVIDEYYSAVNELYVQIILEAIDPNTFKKYSYFRAYGIGIETETCQNSFYFFKQHTFDLDYGNGFSKNIQQTYISDVVQQSYTTTSEYCEAGYRRKVAAAIFIMRDNQFTLWKMIYPSIFETIGNIESIISLMLFIKFFIMEFNRIVMRNNIIESLVSQFYPEMKDCIIRTNLWGRIKEVTLKKKKIDVRSFQAFSGQVRKQLQCKLNFENIIYEITRLQYIVQSLQKREYIKKCHHVGIRIKLKRKLDQDCYEVVDEGKGLQTTNIFDTKNIYFDNVDVLKVQDTVLLSQQTQNAMNSNPYCEEEMEIQDFYETNRIISSRQ